MPRRKVEKIKFNCIQCGKEIWVHPSRAKRGNVKFCSNSCTTTYRNLKNNPSKNQEIKLKIGKASKERQVNMDRGLHGRYGSDGKHGYGKDNPTYKNGIALYRRIIEERGFCCEKCGNAFDPKMLEVHHRDKNRKNNEPDNLEVLCKTCHHGDRHNVVDRLNNDYELTQKRKAFFLEQYKEIRNAKKIMEMMGLHRDRYNRWRKTDPEFDRAYKELQRNR
ncbi:HNH endonuclease signature motif containing protein [Neobacillus sp. C211]|uniref:HNH endonuclease signature motif containing protein n=1 Tax=unclassified Neobacillus TaxID=2675272 RepID=UPI00397DAEF1